MDNTRSFDPSSGSHHSRDPESQVLEEATTASPSSKDIRTFAYQGINQLEKGINI